jgi:hypothetical protein
MKLILWSNNLAMSFHERLGLRREDVILPALSEVLDWGPLHCDPEIQQRLRECYFRQPYKAASVFDKYLGQMPKDDELVFWCERVLPGCLVILWALDHLVSRGAELHRSSLALSPAGAITDPVATDSLCQALSERVPIGETLEPIVAVWRHIASDSYPIAPDLSGIPEPVRGWVAITERMTDHLPDARGLDLVDSIILDALTRSWRRAGRVLGECFDRVPRGQYISDARFGPRLFELAGHTLDWPQVLTRRRQTLVEMCYREEGSGLRPSFRLTLLGLQVREGEVPLPEHIPYCNWVGGRMITNASPLRDDEQQT